MTSKQSEHAKEICRQAVIVNMCNNSTLNDLEDTWNCGITCTGVTPGAASEDFRLVIEKMYGTNDTSVIETVRRANGKASIARSSGDIRNAKTAGKVTVMIGFQNANPLDEDLNFVDLFYDLGVRFIGLTYNYRNHYGDGATERTDCGLSELGIDLVKKLNDSRMLVDLSHTGHQTALDGLRVSKSPVIFSHSNARAVVDNPRNVDDETLKCLAGNGGVIGITAFPSYVRWENPTVSHMVDHMDYVAKRIGSQHLGFGLDLIEGYPNDRYVRADGTLRFGKVKAKAGVAPPWPWIYPTGISKRSEIPNLAEELIVRGYSDEQILGVLGGNFLRVIEQVVG